MGEYVYLEGMKELRRELKKLDAALPKEITVLNRYVADRIVVPDARRRAAGRGNPRVGHKVIDSIRGAGSQTRAQIIGGGARVPEFKGHEFGSMGKRYIPPKKPGGRPGHTTQFPRMSPRRGAGNEGYFMYPAVWDNVPRILDIYDNMLNLLVRSLDLPE